MTLNVGIIGAGRIGQAMAQTAIRAQCPHGVPRPARRMTLLLSTVTVATVSS